MSFASLYSNVLVTRMIALTVTPNGCDSYDSNILKSLQIPAFLFIEMYLKKIWINADKIAFTVMEWNTHYLL